MSQTVGAAPPLQVPPPHVCPVVHALPHVPQLAVLVIKSTHAPEQLVCPPPQAQAPLAQLCPAVHALAHMPQLAVLVIKSTHAPEHAVVLPLHVAAHAPDEQTRPAVQALPQPPQFIGSV